MTAWLQMEAEEQNMMRRTDMHTIANPHQIWLFSQPLLLVCGLQLYGQRVDLPAAAAAKAAAPAAQ